MVLALRTRILLLLVLIGLAPLMVAVVINLPLVLDRVGLFYRHAFLQDLRADFRDLDQHLASRQETVRLLAKLPEPGAVMGTKGDQGRVDQERARYTDWINRILSDQLDVIHISFLDDKGVARFWLERDATEHNWNPTANKPPYPPEDLLAAVLQRALPVVLPTPVRVDPNATDPSHVLTLQLLSPIVPQDGGEAIGAVVVTVDIGGLVRRDPDTLWVRDDGSYLQVPGLPARTGSAFDDFPGLRQRFAEGKIALWDDDDHPTIWVPLLRTSDDRPLWVARRVNRAPLEQFETALVLRVFGVVLLLVLSTLLVARWFAARAERFGSELLDGIRRMLQQDEAVKFSWRGSRELRQLGDNLTRLAETHARNTRNLRAHARELEETNRYKSEFLANVSHELRTPLNSILLLSKLLADEQAGLPAEARQRAAVIHEASKDLRALIDNILDLSRIEAGGLALHPEATDLPQLLTDLMALLRPQFDERGLSLELEVAPDAPAELRTDPDKVRQVLKNFLANAVKFTERGGVRILLQPAAPPYAVRLAVRDTGIGIPENKHAVIFEAFKQADGSTSRRFGGTGLGLTISRDLAELLGGEIQVRSAPGEGAEFALLLPADCACVPAETRRPPPAPPGTAAVTAEAPPPAADFGGQRVLVVDAEVRRLLALTPVLERWGLEVAAAGDADEALETLDEDGIAVALVRVELSGADPYATISAMREHVQHRQMAVIALIPADATAARTAALAAGAASCLPEPLDLAALRDLLARHLTSGVAP